MTGSRKIGIVLQPHANSSFSVIADPQYRNGQWYVAITPRGGDFYLVATVNVQEPSGRSVTVEDLRQLERKYSDKIVYYFLLLKDGDAQLRDRLKKGTVVEEWARFVATQSKDAQSDTQKDVATLDPFYGLDKESKYGVIEVKDAKEECVTVASRSTSKSGNPKYTISVCYTPLKYTLSLEPVYDDELDMSKTIHFELVRRADYKFKIEAGGYSYECVTRWNDGDELNSECKQAIQKAVRRTANHVSVMDVEDVIDSIRKGEERLDLDEYVKSKWGDEYAELEKDPIGYIVRNSDIYVAGYEKPKKFLAIAGFSAYLTKVDGLSGVSLILQSFSGVAKSTMLRSIGLQFPASTVMYMVYTSPKAILYYPNIDKVRIFLIDQLDGISPEALMHGLTEHKLRILTVDSNDKEGRRGKEIVVDFYAVLWASSVGQSIGLEKSQLYNRLFKLYVDPWQGYNEKTNQKIGNKPSLIYFPFKVQAMLACFINHMPKTVYLDNEALKVLDRIDQLVLELTNRSPEALGIANRAKELVRELAKTLASIKGKHVATIEEFRQVLSDFFFEVLVDVFGLSERDFIMMKAIKELILMKFESVPTSEDDLFVATGQDGDKAWLGFNLPSTSDIVKRTHNHRKIVETTLNMLADRGLVFKVEEYNRARWSLTEMGLKLVDYLSSVMDSTERQKVIDRLLNGEV